MSGIAQQAGRLIEQGRMEQARALLTRTLARSPGDADALMAMCYVCAKTGDRARALYFAERAAAALPGDIHAQVNHVQALLDADRTRDAVELGRKLIETHPPEERLYCQLSHALNKLGEAAEAADIAHRGAALFPHSTAILINEAAAAIICGDAARSVACCRAARALDPANATALSNLLTSLNYCDMEVQLDAIRRGETHALYGRLMADTHGPANFEWNVTPDSERPLRVGMLSPDLRTHAVSYFAEPVLRHHDRAQWTMIAYSTANPEDDRSNKLRGLVSEWRRLSGMRFVQIAELIKRDRIDVLIDLAGHTNGHALPALHLRPAPVQITWVGYPHSTGVPSVGYRIVDQITDPPPPAAWRCVETPLYLDPCFLMWEPPEGVPEPTRLPPSLDDNRTPRGTITFGSFTAMQKVSSTTLRLWSAVLRAVPDSTLWIKTTALKTESMRTHIRARFEAAGINGARLRLDPPGASAQEMMSLYAGMDIALDTYPYHGTTTTCESLWMGVPMVALEGPSDVGIPAARVSGSIIRAVCGDDALRLLASTEEEYVSKAAALAADKQQLVRWRSDGPDGLRARMAASCIRRGPERCRELESLVRGCWRKWCASNR